MTTKDEQNFRDLSSLVEEVNRAMASSVNFVYLPGDNADHGDASEYEVAREALDRLIVPWFAITGDHDVQRKSRASFLQYMMPLPFYSFDCGPCRIFALDAFASENPREFEISDDQLAWLNLQLLSARGRKKILLLHCYPCELQASAGRLRELIRRNDVLLVDMGHTHYNEIANDRGTLYTATRSTGQIEEGPVGFSVTNVDRGTVSWKFMPSGEWPLAMITSPGDRRLRTRHSEGRRGEQILVRVKAWSDAPMAGGFARLGDEAVALAQIHRSPVWEAELKRADHLAAGEELRVEMKDQAGRTAVDVLQLSGRNREPAVPRLGLETEHVVGAWPERNILGTQLGPNKNGRKW